MYPPMAMFIRFMVYLVNDFRLDLFGILVSSINTESLEDIKGEITSLN